MVANARLNGHNWDEIAHAIGTSSEEAHLRFDPAERLSRSRSNPQPADCKKHARSQHALDQQ
jgi:hypothetical protein